MNRLLSILLRHAWVTALVLALGTHLLWAVWMPAPRVLRDGAPRRAITAVRYEASRSWRELQRVRRDDARLLLSSALFALPTPLGFSGPELDSEMRYAPTFAEPAPASSSSLRRELSLGRAPVAPAWTALSTGLLQVSQARAPVFGAVAAAPANSIHLRWSDDFPGADPRVLTVAEAALSDPAPWEIAAAVRYDERGALRETFLDPPGPRPDRNAAVVRLLHTLPPPPGSASRSGRVFLRYSGPPAGAAT